MTLQSPASRQLVRVAVIVALLATGCADRSSAAPAPLVVEATITLPNTRGRVDHLTLDVQRLRLFVAEIDNGSVDVVDLKTKTVVGRIPDLHEPQGLGYWPERNELVVACGGDGTIRFYDAATLKLTWSLSGFDDADNVRIDPVSGDVVVGYGSGGLVLIDPARHAVVAKVALPSHPEGFQIAPDGKRAFVNLPRSASIAVVDLAAPWAKSSWPAHSGFENFPMAADWASATIAVGFRLPGRFMTFDMTTGAVTANLAACGTADDLFHDGKRKRFYMLCGDGHIDVFTQPAGQRFPDTRTRLPFGGRTGLFSPDLDRLFVVESGTASATVQVLRPE